MPVMYIDEAAAHAGQEVTIRGWLRSRRDKGKLHFLIVRDGTGDIQAVVSKATVGDAQFARSAELTQESSLVLTGTLRQDVRAPGGYELDVLRLEVLQVAEPFPIQPKEHGTGGNFCGVIVTGARARRSGSARCWLRVAPGFARSTACKIRPIGRTPRPRDSPACFPADRT